MDAGTASVCKGLVKNTSLVTCFLGKNKCSDASADSIAKSLSQNHVLKEFSLGDNQVILSPDWATVNLKIVYLHGNSKLTNCPHKYLYNKLPKIKAHLRAKQIEDEKAKLPEAISNRKIKPLQDLIATLMKLECKDRELDRAKLLVQELITESEAIAATTRALSNLQLLPLDSAVRRMEALNLQHDSIYKIAKKRCDAMEADMIRLRVKLSDACKGNLFALLNNPSDALQSMDAIIGPMQTQQLLNTIRVSQNLESNVVARLSAFEAGEGDAKLTKFITPKDNELVVEAKEELGDFDKSLKKQGSWTVDERERLIFVVTCGIKAFFDGEILIAKKRTDILAHTYRSLRSGHKSAYLNTLKGIGKEPRFDEVESLMGEWIEEIAKNEFKARQSSSEIITVFEGGQRVRERYLKFMDTLASKSGGKFLQAEMKSLWRAIEKVSLKVEADKGDCSKVCDIVRGALSFDSMSKMYNALRLIQGCNVNNSLPDVAGVNQAIKLVRCKDRFSEPTSGGWADIMINFSFVGGEDGKMHVCEIQMVHEQLVLVRKQWGAHKSYSLFRAALELLEATENDELIQKIEDEEAAKEASEVVEEDTLLPAAGPYVPKLQQQIDLLKLQLSAGTVSSSQAKRLSASWSNSDMFAGAGQIGRFSTFSAEPTSMAPKEEGTSSSAQLHEMNTKLDMLLRQNQGGLFPP
jgi:hypothetical protein